MEVNVTQSGHYLIDSEISPFIEFWIPPYAWRTYYQLNIGVYNITIIEYVTIPYSLRLNTAFKLKSSIYFEGYQIDWLREPYVSNFYNYSEFDPPDAVLTGQIWDYGVDTDFDGKFDRIVFDQEISETDRYFIYISYSSNWGSFHQDIQTDELWGAGINNLSISLSSTQLFLEPTDTNYVIEKLFIYDGAGNLLDLLPASFHGRIFGNDELDAPGAYLTGSFTDTPINIDSDENYELIRIYVGVNVTVAGYYSPFFDFQVNYQSEYFSSPEVFNLTVQGFWEEGSHAIPVDIPSSFYIFSSLPSLFILGIEQVQLLDEENRLIHCIFYPYFSRECHTDEFDLFYIKDSTYLINPENCLLESLIIASITLYFVLNYFKSSLKRKN